MRSGPAQPKIGQPYWVEEGQTPCKATTAKAADLGLAPERAPPPPPIGTTTLMTGLDLLGGEGVTVATVAGTVVELAEAGVVTPTITPAKTTTTTTTHARITTPIRVTTHARTTTPIRVITTT